MGSFVACYSPSWWYWDCFECLAVSYFFISLLKKAEMLDHRMLCYIA
jgi:hypothetical protein